MSKIISMANKVLDESQIYWDIMVSPDCVPERVHVYLHDDMETKCNIYICIRDFDQIPKWKKIALAKLEQELKAQSMVLRKEA